MSDGKWLVPQTINPPTTVCVQIEIPNETYYIAAFWGAIEELGKAWNWEDSFGDGSLVAYVWQPIIEAASEAVRNGVNCMCPVDCNEVEVCLTTSAIIAAIEANILTLQLEMNTAQADILINAADILTNTTQIGINTGDIATHDIEIGILQTAVAINSGNIATHTLEIADHETRILALENAPSGNAALVKLHDMTIFTPASNYTTTNTSWVAVDLTNVAISGLLNGYGLTTVRFTFLARMTGGTSVNLLQFRIAHAGGTSFPQAVRSVDGSDNNFITIIASFEDVPSGLTSFWLEWIVSASNATIRADPISIEIWEIAPEPIPEPLGIVTFDAGGYSLHTQVADPNQWAITANGNPDNCVEIANLSDDDWLEIEIDLQEEYTIDNILYDMLQSVETSSTSFIVYADDVLELLYGNSFHDTGAWDAVDVDADTSGSFPFQATRIRIRFEANTSGISLLRIDNINIVVS